MKRLTILTCCLALYLMTAGCQTVPRDGHGTLRSGGGSYVGEFRNGKFHGIGTLTGADGGVYVGGFANGMPYGHGTNTAANGKKYIGEFNGSEGGIALGKGVIEFPNGDRYVGNFKGMQRHGKGTHTFSDGRVKEGVWKNDIFSYAKNVTPKSIRKKSPPPRIASKPKPKSPPPAKSASSGSGFFVSKLGHIVTNQHVVRSCKGVTVGDNANSQVKAEVVETDRRNDLALLKISSTEMASADTKSLIRKLGTALSRNLGIKVVPLSSNGLLRSDDVELGESLLVAGYPYGDIFSNTIKVTKGIVSAIRGIGDDSGQFQLDAAVQPGNSGGPIYDENGNIVGVVVAQLNKLKMAKTIGSLPENVNFGIKASTVRQFLTSAGLPTKWSSRTSSMSTRDLAKIAKNQTVMVVCQR
jgi:S1-C subfamily serine protease